MDKRHLMNNFIDNVEKERIKLGYTQKGMAKELGKSLSGYKKLIAGENSKIDLFLALRVSELTGRCMTDLCGMEGTISGIEKRLPKLSATQLEFVRAVVDFEADFAVSVPETEDYVTMMILTGDFKDGMILDSANLEKVNVAAYRGRFGDNLHCAIRVSSNHLHPVYHRGDILLISRQPPRDGDTGIFVNRVTGRVYIRKYYQTIPVRLEPVNGLGREITVDSSDVKDMDQWIKFGKVLTKMRS